MILDNRNPEELTEKDWERVKKEGRIAGLTTAGIGALTYGANRFAGPKGREKAYKIAKRSGIGVTAAGLTGTGLLEYAHYKRKKKSKKDDSKEKK